MDNSNIKIALWPVNDERALKLEYDVFLDTGYIEPNDENRVLQYEPYTHAEFLVALVDGYVAGVMRILYDWESSSDLPQLPTLKDFDLYPESKCKLEAIPFRRLLEFGTMAIKKPYRATSVRRQLVKHCLLTAWRKQVWHAISSLDERFFNSLKRAGLPCVQIGPARDYMGSITIPTYFSSTEVPWKYRWVFYMYKLRALTQCSMK